MNVIKNETHVMIDIDDTLVMWNKKKHKDKKKFICPYSNEKLFLVPHKDHIKILKDQKARGFYVTVWSNAGWRWAETVIRTLKLEAYVDEVRTKPTKYIDDLEAPQILGQRLYVQFK